jgi:hypothetical protein
MQDSTNVSNESSGGSSNANNSLIVRFGSDIAVVALVLAIVALLFMLFLNSILQVRIDSLERLQQTKFDAIDRIVELRVQAGIARAEAVAESSRVNSRLALEKISEVREGLIAKGVDLQH